MRCLVNFIEAMPEPSLLYKHISLKSNSLWDVSHLSEKFIAMLSSFVPPYVLCQNLLLNLFDDYSTDVEFLYTPRTFTNKSLITGMSFYNLMIARLDKDFTQKNEFKIVVKSCIDLLNDRNAFLRVLVWQLLGKLVDIVDPSMIDDPDIIFDKLFEDLQGFPIVFDVIFGKFAFNFFRKVRFGV